MGITDNTLDSVTKCAALMFAVVFVVVGVPLWWKTTEVYRVSLPYAEIEELRTESVIQKIDVNIIVPKRLQSVGNLQEYFDKLSLQKDGSLLFNYNWNARSYNEEENYLVKNSSTISELDYKFGELNSHISPGRILIYVLEDESYETVFNFQYIVGLYRSVFLKFENDYEGLVTNCVDIVRNVIVKEKVLQKSYDALQSGTLKDHHPDKDQMRSVHATPAYDITFSLVQAEPLISWDMEEAIEDYLRPFLRKLSYFADFNIKSQVFYLTELNVKPKFDAETGHHILHPDQFTHIINPVEELLASHVSTNPNLNFLVYIPPKDKTPMKIYDEEGNPSKTNAFLSPRWGGFLFYNYNHTGGDILDMEHIINVFVTQLRKLIGLPDVPLQSLAMDSSLISDFEVDFLLRKRNLENLAVSIGSLNSLAQLLYEIRNIVINDDVGAQVYKSVEAVEKSIQFLKEGDLKSGFTKSKQSFIASEKAFFDPSMLKLLYFPDDQKYAIYIPLFLPVGLTIFTSIVRLFKSYKVSKTKID